FSFTQSAGRRGIDTTAGPRIAGGPAVIVTASLVSILAVHNLVAASHQAVVEVVPAVHLDMAATVVDEDVVAGTADEVRRRHRVGDLQCVVAAVADQRDAVDVVGRQVVVAGVTPDHRVAAGANRDRVVPGAAADEVVAAPAVDGVVAVAADDGVVTPS